jgi:hypothetical protein
VTIRSQKRYVGYFASNVGASRPLISLRLLQVGFQSPPRNASSIIVEVRGRVEAREQASETHGREGRGGGRMGRSAGFGVLIRRDAEPPRGVEARRRFWMRVCMGDRCCVTDGVLRFAWTLHHWCVVGCVVGCVHGWEGPLNHKSQIIKPRKDVAHV